MALLYGRAWRLTAENGGFWPGQVLARMEWEGALLQDPKAALRQVIGSQTGLSDRLPSGCAGSLTPRLTPRLTPPRTLRQLVLVPLTDAAAEAEADAAAAQEVRAA